MLAVVVVIVQVDRPLQWCQMPWTITTSPYTPGAGRPSTVLPDL